MIYIVLYTVLPFFAIQFVGECFSISAKIYNIMEWNKCVALVGRTVGKVYSYFWGSNR
jgi:hypothetical protein